MRSGYVLLRRAAGPGVKVRLHARQRQTWTISSFLRRVPFRLRLAPPQCGQRSGRLAVCGTRAIRGAGLDIIEMSGRHGSMSGDVGKTPLTPAQWHAMNCLLK